MLAYVLEHALDAGQASVKRGPELLPILRESGVVDAGGYGLTIIFAGVIAALRGAEPPPLEHHAPARVTHPEHHSSTYRYCTNFAVTGDNLEPDAVAAAAGGDRRLGAGGRRLHDLEGARPHRRARARHAPVRRRRRGLPPGRRGHARAGRAAHRPRERGHRHLRRARGRQRRRDARALRGHGRPRAGRRADAEPEHLRAAGRHPRRARRRGRRPAQLAQRPDGRRARRRAEREGRPGRPDPLDGRRPGRRRRAGRRRRRAPQRRRDGGGAASTSAPAA